MNSENSSDHQPSASTSDSWEEEQRQIDQISTRAYYLWEAAGRPDGQDDDFWLAAENEFAEPAKS